jgi:hypothetical protein
MPIHNWNLALEPIIFATIDAVKPESVLERPWPLRAAARMLGGFTVNFTAVLLGDHPLSGRRRG